MTTNATASKPIDAWRNAVRRSTLPPVARAVAIAITRYMDLEDLGDVRPGPTRLAADTGYSERSVKRALGVLVEEGWLVKTFTGGSVTGKGRRASIYKGRYPSKPSAEDRFDPCHSVTGQSTHPCLSDTGTRDRESHHLQRTGPRRVNGGGGGTGPGLRPVPAPSASAQTLTVDEVVKVAVRSHRNYVIEPETTDAIYAMVEAAFPDDAEPEESIDKHARALCAEHGLPAWEFGHWIAAALHFAKPTPPGHCRVCRKRDAECEGHTKAEWQRRR